MLNKYINLSNLLNRIISMYNYQKNYIYIVCLLYTSDAADE